MQSYKTTGPISILGLGAGTGLGLLLARKISNKAFGTIFGGITGTDQCFFVIRSDRLSVKTFY